MVDCAGAAVGTAFGALFELVEHVVKTVAAFRGELKKIETTLVSIEPIIKDIDKFNDQLHRGPEEMALIKDLLEEGKELVNKCSRIRKRYLYTHSKKLTDFNAALLNKFQIYMPSLNLLTSKETSVDVKTIGMDVKTIGSDLKDVMDMLRNREAPQSRLEASRDLAVCAAPGSIVGSKVEASVSARTESGGCGEITAHEATIEGAAVGAAFNELFEEEQEMRIDFRGAAVGAAFNQLFAAVREVVQTIRPFGVQLEKIENTLGRMEPIIRDWDEFNNRLDRNPKEMRLIKELLDKGKGLVEKCSSVHRFNMRKKYTHSKKLKAFNAELLGDFILYIDLLDARNNSETLYEVREMRIEFDRLISSRKANSVVLQSGFGASGNLAVPDAPDFVVGSVVEASLRKLREQLLEEGVSVIVVTAPGGCGKTTLLKKLCHDIDIEGKFNIMFVPVSKKPTLTDIVRKMIQHNGLDVPEIVTEDDAVRYLQQLLIKIGQNPVLLVLDDVWTDSQSIIEKFVFKKIKHYKIVVTSRYEFPNVDLVHHLNPLPHEEALELFRRSVTVDGRRLVAPDDELWDKIVKRCKGLPLALTVVAKSLQGKDRSFWETKLLNLSRLGLDSDILDCLRKSLDDLDGNPSIKERFMDLGSFPEDRKIPATALIDMWVELYRQDFDGILAINDLHELIYRNLADLVITRRDSDEDEDKCYSSHYATQHNLLRELAIVECNQGDVKNRERLILDLAKNNFPDWWSKQKQSTLGARLVSISTNGTFSTPWPDLRLPEVEALVLNFETNIQTKSYALPRFIEKADKLKALIVTNYSFFPAELGNFHVVRPSLRRIRLERVTVSLLSMGKLHLHNLQKISFFRCNIGQASTSNDAKISNAMPNLVELDIDYCNDLVTLPDGICEIKPLKRLSITNCHNCSALPKQLGQLTSLEVVRLNSCTNLLELPNSIGTLQKLISLNISDCLSLSTLPHQIGQLNNLKRINMKGCPRLSVVPWLTMRLSNLKEVNCDKKIEVLWEPFKYNLDSLNIMVSEEEANLDWLHD